MSNSKNVRELKLEGKGGDLYIIVDEMGWSRSYLQTAQTNVFLGAESIQILVAQLTLNLDNVRREAAGDIDGRSVWWVASLAEAHHTLYFYIEDGDRILLWQDANASLVSGVRLSGEQYQRWQEQLMLEAADKHEI